MALWGNNVSTQIINIPTQWRLRGASSFALGAWMFWPTGISGTRSLWRHDLTLVPLQVTAGLYVRSAWWDTAGTLLNGSDPPTTHFGRTTALAPIFPMSRWVFVLLNYVQSGVASYYYAPGLGVVQPTGTAAWTAVRATQTTPTMRVGGTESNTEMIPAGTAVAELLMVPGGIAPNEIPALAHEPEMYRKTLSFYAPLRDPGRMTTEALAGRAHKLVYGTTSRQQIDPGAHPPVERWRTGRPFAMPGLRPNALRVRMG